MRSVCTIVNFDYLGQATVLFESLKATNSNINYYVLLLDGQGEPFDLIPGVITIHPNQLSMSDKTFLEMCEYYDVIELATSLKPFLLRYLIDLGSTSALYLDPDVQVFSSLEKVFTHTEDFGTTITPHRLTPTSGANPGFHELSFLRYGVYNLGYIGVTSSSIKMLDWWSQRLVRYSGKFPEENIFTDQKWIDLARAYFDFYVITDRTINIAPWNLDERSLFYLNEKLMCDDGPVVFIHFSQLSSSLSRGIFLPYWQQTLSEAEKDLRSLDIISGITATYAVLLQNANKKSVQYPGKISRIKPHYKSSVLRKVLRDHYLKADSNPNSLKTERHFSKHFKKHFDKLLIKLERSFLFRYSVYGLGVDLSRLAARLKKHPH